MLICHLMLKSGLRRPHFEVVERAFSLFYAKKKSWELGGCWLNVCKWNYGGISLHIQTVGSKCNHFGKLKLNISLSKTFPIHQHVLGSNKFN